MNSLSDTSRGTLRSHEGQTCIEAADGRRLLGDENVWRGYLDHFIDCPVRARHLPEVDYETGRPICILWPDEDPPTDEFIELYYNERLVKYAASLLGHNAINVNGRIFNFSHRLDENEILTHEEYFYRPALGEFAPSPRTGRNEVIDGRRYLDKFGRRFMRTIHVVRVFGIDTRRLDAIFAVTMKRIRDSRGTGSDDGKWSEFNPVTRNCTTLIRDGLNAYGFTDIRGRFPRDLFVNMAFHLSRRPDLRVEIMTLPQMKVAEAPYSEAALLVDPRNYWRQNRIAAAA